MVYTYHPSIPDTWTVRTATSPDGFVWTDGPEVPYNVPGTDFLYEHNGLYYITGHMLLRSEGGHPSGRQGYAVVSPDFRMWLLSAESRSSSLNRRIPRRAASKDSMSRYTSE